MSNNQRVVALMKGRNKDVVARLREVQRKVAILRSIGAKEVTISAYVKHWLSI